MNCLKKPRARFCIHVYVRESDGIVSIGRSRDVYRERSTRFNVKYSSLYLSNVYLLRYPRSKRLLQSTGNKLEIDLCSLS